MPHDPSAGPIPGGPPVTGGGPVPVAPPAGPAGAAAGAPGPVQLSPEEYAILDRAFTPDVLNILMKVVPPEVAAALQQFMNSQQTSAPAGPVPGPVPQSGLGNVIPR